VVQAELVARAPTRPSPEPDRADGMPLYIEELTRSVVEPGTAPSVEAIPATLADSLMGRLDRLSATKEVAQRAAVLGREFAYPLLEAVAGLEAAALRHGPPREGCRLDWMSLGSSPGPVDEDGVLRRQGDDDGPHRLDPARR
jgi:hypothetical protein